MKRALIFLFSFTTLIPQQVSSVVIEGNWSFEMKNTTNGFPSNDVRTMWQDSVGYMWFVTNYGTYRYDGYEYVQCEDMIPILADAGRTWLDTDGTFRFKAGGRDVVWRIYEETRQTVNANGKFGYVEDEEFVFISTYGNGLFVYEIATGKMTHMTRENGQLQSNYINGIYMDRAHNLWIAQENFGILMMSKARPRYEVITVGKGEHERVNDIKVLEYMPDGRIAVANNYGGLYALKGIDVQQIGENKKSKFSCIAYDVCGTMWKGSKDNGLFIGDVHLKHEKDNPESVMRGRIDDIVCDRQGRMWLSGVFGALCVSDDGGRSFRHLLPWLKKEEIRGMMLGRDGRMWIGMNGTLLSFVPDSLLADEKNCKTITLSEKNPKIYSISEDSEGRIWVATGGEGIYVVNHTDGVSVAIKQICKENNGLVCDIVTAVRECTPHHMLAATLDGCSVIDKDSVRIRNIRFGDNLLLKRFNEDCMLVDGERVLLGGLQGIVSMDIREIVEGMDRSRNIENFRFTTMFVNGVAESPDSINRWESSCRSFAFHVSDFNYTSESHFLFHLEGDGEEWTRLTTENRVEYQNLRPGKYTLHVRQMDESGNLHEEELIYEFKILVPLWRRWWMWLVYAIVVGFAIWLIRHWNMTVQTFKQRLKAKPKAELPEFSADSQEREFIERVAAVVEAHIFDGNLTPDLIAQEMGYSRTSFFRKFGELAGMTPKNYIVNQKMQKAAHLLQEPNVTVADVAYKMGYNSPQYFSTAFKQFYKISPSEYQKGKIATSDELRATNE